MNKSVLLYIGFTGLFLILALYTNQKMKSSDRLLLYVDRIEEGLHEHEKKVEKIIQDHDFLKRRLTASNKVSNIPDDSDLAKLEELSAEPFSIVFKMAGDPVFWSSTATPFESVDYTQIPQTGELTMLELSNGIYLGKRESIPGDFFDTYESYSLFPIKRVYSIESPYLEKHFTTKDYVPNSATLTSIPNQYPIKDTHGHVVCYLDASLDAVDKTSLKRLAIFYGLFFLFLGLLVNHFSKLLAVKYTLAAGGALLISSIFTFKYFTNFCGFTDQFSELSLFSRDFFNFYLSQSLGDLLINIGLFLWINLFFHRHIGDYSFDRISPKLKHVLGFMNASVVSLSIVNVANVIRGLILDSTIEFDFSYMLNIKNESLLAIFGVIFLTLGLFLFSHLLMLINRRLELPIINRQIMYFASTALAIPFLHAANLELDNIRFMLFILLYQVLFDIFVYNKQNNLTWLVIWIVIMSGFSSSLIYNFGEDKDIKQRVNYAKILSENKDAIIEKQLVDFTTVLHEHKSADFNTKSDNERRKELQHIVSKFIAKKTYLFNNYTYDVVIGTIEQLPFQNSILEQVGSTDSPISRSQGEDYDYNYYYTLAADQVSQMPLTIEFKREQRQQSKVYTELMTNKSYMGLDNLGNYDYAIYKNGQNVIKTDPYYGEFLASQGSLPEKGQYSIQEMDQRSQVTYQGENNTVVLINKKLEGWIKPISLFSYLFTLLIIITMGLGFVNLFINFIPKSLSFSIIRKPSLKNRIQLSVIALIVASFLIIGIVTVIFFSQSHVQYHEDRLKRKTNSVIRDTEHELKIMAAVDSTLTTPKDFLDNLKIHEISDIHRIDINLYDLQGDLSKTSEEDFFERGILSTKINPSAYMALSTMNQKDYVQENEHIGDFVYKAAYIPVRLRRKDQSSLVLGYLSLPYYSQLSSTRSDAISFMGTLLNVYVFLLLIAGVIAIVVANSITKPLTSIGQKLNAFRLGGRNEKLEYSSQDELGILVNEYNKMVQNIRESAEMLAQSEREGAWREMAKQVAHEIKNPLTPMKLSIQYLMHAYNNGDQEDIGPLMSRVSTTLIQQIDNLAQIATEFSNFAKMPRAENTRLEINSLLESVYNLFQEVKEVNLTIDIPDHQLTVYADKNHLVSVFNNIIKNAIQAIPEGQVDGRVDVRLYEADGKAIVKITDNGSGISDEMRDKVFVPNFTTKSSGTGLGLAISKNIIESVDGAITFETEPGEGTDFYVTLPIIYKDELQPA